MGGTVRVRTVASLGLAVLVGFVMAVALLWAMRADAAPGDVDTTFVPVAPCRLADTRPAPDRVGSAGSFGADETKTFVARGSNGKCVLPADAVGLSLNVTAVGASAAGWLRVWPCGSPEPSTASVNYRESLAFPNAVVVPVDSSGAVCVVSQRSTDVVVDVSGWFESGVKSGSGELRLIDTRYGSRATSG